VKDSSRLPKMWSWFGGAAAQKRKEAPKNAILQLRSHLDMLQKREKHLENQMNEQEAIAKKNVTTNKNGVYIMGPLYKFPC
jgi:charged multivesicular body protein 4